MLTIEQLKEAERWWSGVTSAISAATLAAFGITKDTATGWWLEGVYGRGLHDRLVQLHINRRRLRKQAKMKAFGAKNDR